MQDSYNKQQVILLNLQDSNNKLLEGLRGKDEEIMKFKQQLNDRQQHLNKAKLELKKFQQISDAYNTLRDPQSRAGYDHSLRNPQPQYQQYQGNPFRGGGSPFEFHFSSGGGPDPFANFHEQFFNQFGFQTRQQPRNRNLRVVVELQFLETLNPLTKVIEYKTTNNTERLNIEIPAGIEDGYTYSVVGRGDIDREIRVRLDLVLIAEHPEGQQGDVDIPRIEDVVHERGMGGRGRGIGTAQPQPAVELAGRLPHRAPHG